jgi:hypothetical protein
VFAPRLGHFCPPSIFSLRLPKGPFPNSIFIPSLTHPALNDVFCFRVSASVFSVKFRVNPWQMLLLVLISVANFLLLLILPSVKFRVNPWQMLLLILPSVANSASFRVNPWLIFSLLLPLLSVYSVLKPSRWGWVN